MATISSGSVTITIQPGEQYRFIATGEAYVDIGGGSTESYRLTGATSEKLLGGFIVATPVTIRVISGSVEYRIEPYIAGVAGVGNGNIYDENGEEITLGVTPGGSLTSSRSTNNNDNQKLLRNETSTNYTLTIVANTTPSGGAAIQIGSGLVTLAAGAGVNLRGSPLQTYLPNDIIFWEPTGISENDFVVKVS